MYVALTAVSAAFGLSSGAVQIRISEALCVLPVFTSSAIPGVAIGCMISNLIFGASLPDIIFGSIATLIGAVIAYLIRKNTVYCCGSYDYFQCSYNSRRPYPSGSGRMESVFLFCGNSRIWRTHSMRCAGNCAGPVVCQT